MKGVISRDEPVVELWRGRDEAHDEIIGATHCRFNGEVLFATVSVIVSDDGNDALGAATYTAYRSLLDALQVTGYPHLLRIWNSIPGINVDDGGLERYRRFNLHRYKAYTESKRPTESGAPAACALGSYGGPLVLYCLASKTPVESIENPRQTSAYRYPQQYGPRAPSFSRAALWSGAGSDSDILFVSGTASIVGHQTPHLGSRGAGARNAYESAIRRCSSNKPWCARHHATLGSDAESLCAPRERPASGAAGSGRARARCGRRFIPARRHMPCRFASGNRSDRPGAICGNQDRNNRYAGFSVSFQ
jgi:hypothetical protein